MWNIYVIQSRKCVASFRQASIPPALSLPAPAGNLFTVPSSSSQWFFWKYKQTHTHTYLTWLNAKLCQEAFLLPLALCFLEFSMPWILTCFSQFYPLYFVVILASGMSTLWTLPLDCRVPFSLPFSLLPLSFSESLFSGPSLCLNLCFLTSCADQFGLHFQQLPLAVKTRPCRRGGLPIISQTLVFLGDHSAVRSLSDFGNVFFSHLQLWAWEAQIPLRRCSPVGGDFGDWQHVAPGPPSQFCS